MKLVHMRSRKGRRGRKWFPNTDRRPALPPASMIPAFIAALLGGRR